MAERSIKPIFRSYVHQFLKGQKFSGIYFGNHSNKFLCLLKYSDTLMLVFKNDDLSNLEFSKIIHSDGISPGEVDIVGNSNQILLLDDEGNLWELNTFQLSTECKFHWVHLKNFTLKVCAITVYELGFACLGVNENGKKFLKTIGLSTSPGFIGCALGDLNETRSNEYHLGTVFGRYGTQSLIISDRLSGRTYLLSDKGLRFLYCSDVRLISTFSITSKDCVLLCFESGKLVVHPLDESSADRTLFLTKRIACIEKCPCSYGCLLWSDGANLHHTKINFNEDNLKMTHLKVECNVRGVLSFAKCEACIIAVTINDVYYKIGVDTLEGKVLVQRPGEILSQIFNESLKINDFQKNLAVASEYVNWKGIMQTVRVNMELNWEGNVISIKNTAEVTFKKEVWKIKLKMSIQGRECVKMIELETDLVEGMMIKIQNPFFGAVGEEDDSGRERLKKRLDEIRLQKNK